MGVRAEILGWSLSSAYPATATPAPEAPKAEAPRRAQPHRRPNLHPLARGAWESLDDRLARVLRRLVALSWILLEHAVEHRGQGLGYVLPDLPDRHRLDGRLLHENLLRRLAVKRGSAGEHLVQHDTEAVDVRPVVGPFAGGLFRAH